MINGAKPRWAAKDSNLGAPASLWRFVRIHHESVHSANITPNPNAIIPNAIPAPISCASLWFIVLMGLGCWLLDPFHEVRVDRGLPLGVEGHLRE